MQLLPGNIAKQLPPLYSQEEQGENAIAVVKFFTPWTGWTWYASEYDPGTDRDVGCGSRGFMPLRTLRNQRPCGSRVDHTTAFVLQQPALLRMLCWIMVDGLDSAAGGGPAAIRRGPSARLVCCLVSICVLRLAAHAAESEAPPLQEPIVAAIRGIVEAGRQPLLHRPDFSDRQDSTRRLYEVANFRPLWLRSDKPTSQAAEILRALSEADRRGLSPEDYDAARLRDEAARFDSATPPAAADAGAFDTALTVCVLRYISDAHLGHVPPRAVGFALEMEARRFDPVAFVSQLPAAEAPARLLATLDPQFALFGPLITALAH
jgi:hypothetical protein